MAALPWVWRGEGEGPGQVYLFGQRGKRSRLGPCTARPSLCPASALMARVSRSHRCPQPIYPSSPAPAMGLAEPNAGTRTQLFCRKLAF